MKISRTAVATAAIPLLLASLTVSAGELPFNAPQTARAQESAQLLRETAQALSDQPAIAKDQHIANLWLFPTGDTNTVFAQYDLSPNGQGGVTTRHLAVLKVSDHHIVEQTDLTDVSAYVASSNERPSATPHWSASIGTGHAADANTTSSSQGVPATPHWTAKIGTGAAASSVNATESQQASSSTQKSAVADAHWTSRIGTGHAAESTGQEGT